MRTGAALPQGVFEMTRVQIMDPAGFDKPLLAATALVPAGWRPEGGVPGLLGAARAGRVVEPDALGRPERPRSGGGLR